jgi:hypothetical protein
MSVKLKSSSFKSSIDVIKTILQNMSEMIGNQDTGPIIDAKILNVARDVTRIFPLYLTKIMNLTSEYESSDPSESSEVLINETINRLLKLGKYFHDRSPVKKEFVDSVHEKHPELLPNQSNIGKKGFFFL